MENISLEKGGIEIYLFFRIFIFLDFILQNFSKIKKGGIAKWRLYKIEKRSYRKMMENKKSEK